jgi:hypothetical protein
VMLDQPDIATTPQLFASATYSPNSNGYADMRFDAWTPA